MIAALLSLLEDEEAALLRSDVHAALALQENKADLLSRVRESEVPTLEDLSRIRAVALRNERLLGLTLDACKQANKRVAEIEGRAARVGYGADGEGVSYAEDRSKRRF